MPCIVRLVSSPSVELVESGEVQIAFIVRIVREMIWTTPDGQVIARKRKVLAKVTRMLG